MAGFCFAVSGLFAGVVVVDGNHGLGPFSLVLTPHETCCGRPRLLNRPCGRSFGIICDDTGLNLKSKGER